VQHQIDYVLSVFGTESAYAAETNIFNTFLESNYSRILVRYSESYEFLKLLSVCCQFCCWCRTYSRSFSGTFEAESVQVSNTKVVALFNIFRTSTRTLFFMEYNSSYYFFKIYYPLGAGFSLNICSVRTFSIATCFKFL
jgi:hypothetical protein